MEMQLLPFDSPLWEIHTGAYGNVCPEIKLLMGAAPVTSQNKLRRLDFEEKDDEQIAFDNLCESLSHQMSFYSAQYLALPYIVKLLEQKKAADNFQWQLNILSEAGVILATDLPETHETCNMEPAAEEITASHQAAILRLRELAQEFVLNNLEQLSRQDDHILTYFLTGLLAIMGESSFANILCMSCWEECYLLCPDCDFCDEDHAMTDSEMQRQITPASAPTWDGHSFDDPLCWLTGLLDKLDNQPAKELILYVYGTYTCPECGRQAPLLDFAKYYLLEA